jgi:hypothetical protein
MFDWFKKSKQAAGPSDGLSAVAGAGVYCVDHLPEQGHVACNLLDPEMQRFLGQCVGAIQRAGVQAKGTGQFSVLLGEELKAELPLDSFWRDFFRSRDPRVVDRVVQAAWSTSVSGTWTGG